MLSHYIELFIYYRTPIVRLLIVVPLIVLVVSILMRAIMPVYTAYAIVSMSPTRVELAYTDAWAKQNSATPGEVSTQTMIEYLNSTPVMEIALDKILERLRGSPERAPVNPIVEALDEAVNVVSEWVWRIYYTLDRGMFVVPTSHELLLFKLKKGTEIEAVMGTFLLMIQVSHEEPTIAAVAANAIADAYVDRASSIAAAKADVLKSALESETQKLEAELAKLDDQRPQILRTRGPEGVDAFQRQIGRVEEDLRATRARLLSIGLEEGNLTNEIQVIEPAAVPVYPSAPRMLIYFLAAIAGSVLIACIGVVASDLVGEKIVTSYDLRRMTQGQYLDAVVERPKFLDKSFLKRSRDRKRETQALVRLSRSASVKGILDTSIVHLVGFLSNREAEIAARRLRDALSLASGLAEPAGHETGTTIDADMPAGRHEALGVPDVVVLPALSRGFHWRTVADAEQGFVVFCIPAGAASYDDIEQLLATSHQGTRPTALFFLVNAPQLGRAGELAAPV